jgi:hypothetical protein
MFFHEPRSLLMKRILLVIASLAALVLNGGAFYSIR